MPQSTKKSRVTINGDRVLEIIDVSVTHPVEEEDTSTIDRAEDAYSPRIDIEDGVPEITMNMYDDITDVGQTHIVLSATGLTVVFYPTGQIAGHRRYTYSNCVVTQDDPPTVAFKGKYKRVVKLKANGGYVKDMVPA